MSALPSRFSVRTAAEKNSMDHRWQISPPPLFYILSKISISKSTKESVSLLQERDKTGGAKNTHN